VDQTPTHCINAAPAFIPIEINGTYGDFDVKRTFGSLLFAH